MAEQICPNSNCRHSRRSHASDGCIEWLDPISAGRRCPCKRKYMDGGWVMGTAREG